MLFKFIINLFTMFTYFLSCSIVAAYKGKQMEQIRLPTKIKVNKAPKLNIITLRITTAKDLSNNNFCLTRFVARLINKIATLAKRLVK